MRLRNLQHVRLRVRLRQGGNLLRPHLRVRVRLRRCGGAIAVAGAE